MFTGDDSCGPPLADLRSRAAGGGANIPVPAIPAVGREPDTAVPAADDGAEPRRCEPNPELGRSRLDIGAVNPDPIPAIPPPPIGPAPLTFPAAAACLAASVAAARALAGLAACKPDPDSSGPSSPNPCAGIDPSVCGNDPNGSASDDGNELAADIGPCAADISSDSALGCVPPGDPACDGDAVAAACKP